MTDATITPIRRRERTTRDPARAALEQRLATINAALADPHLVGWDTELRESRAQLLAQLNTMTADYAA